MARIFMSYASEQRDIADQIQLSLAARKHDIFFDRDDLPEGSTFEAQIEEGVKRSDLFLFLISPESVQDGRFTLTELKFARGKWKTPHGRVLPVMVSPTPMASVPSYLKVVTILEPSGSVSAEVGAAVDAMLKNLRGAGAGLKIAMVSLLALVAAGGAGAYVWLNRDAASPAAEPTGPMSEEAAADACTGSDLYARIASGGMDRAEALSLGRACAETLMPADIAEAPGGDRRADFAKSFAAGATSDDPAERKATAALTLTDKSDAVDAFFALARADSDPSAAAGHYRQAAQAALLSNPGRAVEALTKVVELEPDDFATISQLGGLYRTLGEFEESEKMFARLSSASGGQALDWQGLAAQREADLTALRGDLDGAWAKYETAKAIFQSTSNKWGVASVLSSQSELAFNQGHLDRSEALANDSAAIAKSYGFKDVAAGTTTLKGRIAAARYQFDEADALLATAEKEFRGLHNPPAALFAAHQRGGVAMARQDFKAAKAIFSAVRAEQEQLGFAEGAAWAELGLAGALQATGEFDEAETRFTAAREGFAKLGHSLGEGSALLSLGSLQFARGRLDRSGELLNQALSLGEKAKLVQIEAQAHMNLGFLMRARGDAETALSHYGEAEALYRAQANGMGLMFALMEKGATLGPRDKTAAIGALEEADGLARSLNASEPAQRISFELRSLGASVD